MAKMLAALCANCFLYQNFENFLLHGLKIYDIASYVILGWPCKLNKLLVVVMAE